MRLSDRQIEKAGVGGGGGGEGGEREYVEGSAVSE